MRINKYVATATGLGRRSADKIIAENRITINGQEVTPGATTEGSDIVLLDGKELRLPAKNTLIALNKPVGYVCSREGQGNQTIYEILPLEFRNLKSIGRLDKNSSGLILLTDDGDLANKLTHPKYSKIKTYEIALQTPLRTRDQQLISTKGVALGDGLSKLKLKQKDKKAFQWEVKMREGRNRQIRRTFETLGYKITKLHRISFGDYELGDTTSGSIKVITQ